MSDRVGVCYGAIPFRALRDPRLSRLALCLLGIIAAHDRFGRNGQGCWAGVARLAQLVGCSRGAAHAALVDLADDENPYITMHEIENDGGDSRRRTYEFRVLYTDDDAERFAARDTGSPAKRARRKVSSVDDASPDMSSVEDTSDASNQTQAIDIETECKARGSANIFREAGINIRKPRSAGWQKADARPVLERLQRASGFDDG